MSIIYNLNIIIAGYTQIQPNDFMRRLHKCFFELIKQTESSRNIFSEVGDLGLLMVFVEALSDGFGIFNRIPLSKPIKIFEESTSEASLQQKHGMNGSGDLN